MASTVLPSGIIIPEKFSRDWYADLYHNWQELDNLLGGGTPKDGTLAIQKNGSTVGTFSANQATNETVNITVPTATSELTNDSNFVQSSDLATVATSGSYNDLSNRPTIPSKTSDLTNDSGFITEDTTKIPLAGSNQISGSLIPSTDNSIDIGSSAKNLKMLYTKGITIDAKTIDTDVNGNMTYDGHIVDTIEEQGDGYIRYSNGLQICWTYNALVTQSSSGTWTYPKTFISAPCIWWQATGNNVVYIDAVNSGDVSTSNAVFIPSRYMNGSVVTAPYGVVGLAIGRWK